MRAASSRDTARATCFSWVRPLPIAPGSWPPWPGSIAITISRPGVYASDARLTAWILPLGCRSITIRSPNSPFGRAVNERERTDSVRSITTRSCPSARRPERISRIGPAFSGSAAIALASRLCCRSMTRRSGRDSVKMLCSTGRSRSKTTRVLSLSDQTRISSTVPACTFGTSRASKPKTGSRFAAIKSVKLRARNYVG